MQTSILLSIKPEFANRIFDGSKLFEFRRILFRNRNVKKVVVYATSPVKKIIGEFEIEEILELELDSLWERTKECSGIHKDYFDAYFDGRETGYAIQIGKIQVYETPLELLNLNIKHAPQSFIYLPE